MRMLLLGFSDRFATIAARTGARELLWIGIVAHSIEDFRVDERENVLRLALINHVANKLGLQSSQLLEQAAGISSIRAAKAFRDFDARSPKMKGLNVMGIVEEWSDSGIRYRYE